MGGQKNRWRPKAMAAVDHELHRARKKIYLIGS